ncbi:MAG: hypothetical protein ABIL05_00425 [candidate division WOR-3 bacterium]
MNLTRIIVFISLMMILFQTGFAQHGRFGPGIIIGSPTGLTLKILMTKENSLVFNAGWALGHDEGKLHLTGDYRFHFLNAVPEDPHYQFYLGIGASIVLKEPETKFGVRFGGGMEYVYDPFGFFLELFPVVDLVPDTGFGLEGGLGARIYLPIKRK